VERRFSDYTGFSTGFFGQIPANPTAPNQAARTRYVDDTTTAWSVGGWFIDDPSGFPVGDEPRLCCKD